LGLALAPSELVGAMSRAGMRFVPIKSEEQQDTLMLHRRASCSSSSEQ
jgi:transposase